MNHRLTVATMLEKPCVPSNARLYRRSSSLVDSYVEDQLLLDGAWFWHAVDWFFTRSGKGEAPQIVSCLLAHRICAKAEPRHQSEDLPE